MRLRLDATLVASLTGAVLLAARLDLVPALRGPAPWPPEWQWTPAPLALSAAVLPALVLAAMAVGLAAWSGSGAAARHPRPAGAALGACAFLLSAALPLALLAPVGPPLHELMRRTVHGSFTSYHKVAVSARTDDVPAFLRGHAELLPVLRRGTPHAATHPPGPVLHFRAWLAWARAAPGASARVADALGALGVEPGRLDPVPDTPGLVAAALGALTVALLAAAAAPLAGVLARELGTGVLAAGRVALLVALVPGLALMTPELDQALALPVTLAAVALARALLAATAGRATAWGLGCGLVTGGAGFFSYGAPVLAALACAAVLAALAPSAPAAPVRRVVAVATAGAAAGFLLPLAAGHDPLRSMAAGLALHRASFTAPRSHLLWLAWNPLDVALFLGPPVVLLGAAARDAEPVALARFRRALPVLVLALLASGTIRGEAGRILLPLMPALVVGCAAGASTSAAVASATAALLAATCLVLRLSWQLP